MTHNGSRRQPPAGDNSSLILGILIGMVFGLTVAGGVAWYLTHKHPGVFTRKDDQPPATSQHNDTSAQKQPEAPVASNPAPKTGTPAADKNNYTFYTLLPDGKQGHGQTQAQTHAQAQPASTPAKQAASGKSYYLQAGSFTNAKDANGLREKLALLGLESNVQTADIPGKGIHYRVRLGPYHSTEEMNKADQTLKENGVPNAAQIRNP